MSRNTAFVRVADGAGLGNTSNPQWLDRRQQDQDQQKNRVRVRRYWPGKAPDWAPEEDDDDADDEGADSTFQQQQEPFPSGRAPAVRVEQKDDPRLRRLAGARGSGVPGEAATRRQIRAAQVVDDEEESDGEDEEQRQRAALLRKAQADEDESEEDEEDEDMLELRRMQMRRRVTERKAEEEELALEEEEVEEQEQEDSSEYETDSEEEGPGRAMLKPVFVPKQERETIVEREKIMEEMERDQESAKTRLEERKVETRQIVEAEIRRESEVERADAGVARTSDVDTDDEANEADEYNLWKQRELKRIKRDRDLREAAFKEREELEMLRSMTEEERQAWERKNPKSQKADASKQKYKFLQKYYHKGAFFQEASDDKFGTQGSEEIYSRDYTEAVAEENLDKSILPKAMQLRRGQFGRSGRSKWTHLVAEDTTSRDDQWNSNDALQRKYTAKMAGSSQSFEKPKAKDMLKKSSAF